MGFLEESIIFEAHKIHGNKWAEIAKLFDNRDRKCIKNNYYNKLRVYKKKINQTLKNLWISNISKSDIIDAETLFLLYKTGTQSYSQILQVNCQNETIIELENIMRMLFDHDDNPKVTTRNVNEMLQKLKKMQTNEKK